MKTDGLAFGRTQVAWAGLQLVRMQPGRSAFRGFPMFPWRTVLLDSVPHPVVFATLVRETAWQVEIDDPLATAEK